MKLTYQTPEAVTIGKIYPESAFELQNIWDLEEVVNENSRKLPPLVRQHQSEYRDKVPSVKTILRPKICQIV